MSRRKRRGSPSTCFTLDGIDRVHRLLSNRAAMTALTYLSRAPGPRWIAEETDRSATVTALALLEREGLITLTRPGYPSPDLPVEITPKGMAFVRAAEAAVT